MFVTKKKDIPIHVDPLSFTTDIEVIEGDATQALNRDSGEYMPDRTVYPLVLMPKVIVSDPEGIMSGEVPVTSVLWYEGAPKADNSNQISSDNTNYVISDTNRPTYSLKVKKNIEVNHPLDIHAVYTFVDSRKGTEVKVEREISLYSTLYEITHYHLAMDCPPTFVIDATDEASPVDAPWLHTITAQLLNGTDEVEDAHAAYWWQISDDGSTYREFDDDELACLVQGKDENGNWGKTLTFDARLIRKCSFKCIAEYYDTTRPAIPDTDVHQHIVTVKVIMPQDIEVDLVQTAGMKVSSSMAETVSFTCQLRDKRDVLPTDLFRCEWFAKSAKVGVADKRLGSGFSVSFVPKDLGFDINYPMSVYANVYMYDVHAILTNADGKAITSNGNYIITQKYI